MPVSRYSARAGLPNLIALLFILTATSIANAAERDLVLDPMQPGPYAVGSMNFETSGSAVSQILSQGRDAGQYERGTNLNGELLYIDALLANPHDAFNFSLTVPDDSEIYGASAGTTVPYSGFVLYPTTATNSREDYVVFAGPPLPKMQAAGEGPIFEDNSKLYPLIVYSHGVEDHPTDAILTYLKDIASHGYIVMALFHGDGRWRETEGRRFNLRPLSVKAALDELLAHEDFAGHIDTTRIGGMGESFGGATMLALLGGRVVNPDVASVIANNLLDVQTDSRIKAAATYVPFAGAGLYSLFGVNGSGATGISRPFMANSGTVDTVADYDKIEAVINNMTGDKYLVAYQGEGHDFSDGANVDSSTWMKLFLDAYIKGDSEAISNLNRINSVGDSGQDSLAIAVNDTIAPQPEPPPEPDPVAEPSVFANNVLSIPSVVVDGQAFMVSLTLQSGEPPYTFALTAASNVPTPAAASATFDASTGGLVVPDVQIDGVSYRVEMSLSSQDPVIFTLTTAAAN